MNKAAAIYNKYISSDFLKHINKKNFSLNEITLKVYDIVMLLKNLSVQ